MAYIDTGAYDRWRKAQEQAAASEQYNIQKAALDQKYENKGLGGFLGDIVGGIGKTIGDVGKGVGGLFGTAGASIADLVNSIKDGKATTDSTNAFKRYWYDAEDDKDAALKAAGTSLNAATTLASTILPGVGAGTTAGKIAGGTIANTAAGALGGVADELQQQGKDASFEGATNRAISGAAAGLATGGLNRKIGNATSKVGSTLLNNKLATSAIGRGALSGAVGGSVGAGTSAALAGQDVAQAALQGGLTGAMGGAAQAGIISGAGKAKNALVDKITSDRKQRITDSPVGVATALDTLDEVASPTLRGGVNRSKESINAVRNGQAESATIGKLPVDYMEGLNASPNINYESRIVNNKIMAGGAKNLSVDELAYSTNNYTRSKILEFEKNGTGRLNIVRPISDGKAAVIALEKQPNGNTMITSIRPDVDSNYVRNLQKNKNAKVLYDTIDGAATTSITDDSAASRAIADSNLSVSQNSKNVNTKEQSTSLSGQLRKRAAEKLLDQYGTIDKPMARSANAIDNVQRVADAGFEKPADVERMVSAITGDSGKVTKLTRQLVATAAPVDTFDGIDALIDNQIALNGLTDTDARSVRSILDAQLRRLPSRREGSVTYADNAEDVFDIVKSLEKKSADLKGKSGNNYRNTTPERADKAAVLDSIATVLKDRIYEGAAPMENILTPEVRQDLISLAPKNAKWQNYVDSVIMKANDIGELRSSVAPFVNMGKIIENQYMNYGTYGQRVGDSARDAGKVANALFKVPIAGQVAEAVANSNIAKRAASKAYSTAANIVQNNVPSSSATGRQPANPIIDNPITSMPTGRSNQNILGNYIGRTMGLQQADQNVTNLQKTQDYQNLEDMFSDITSDPAFSSSALTGGGMNSGYDMPSGYNVQNNATSQLVGQLNEITGAMNNALAAGDITAYNQLANMYTTAYKIYQSQAELAGLGSTSNTNTMSTSEKNQLAKLQSAGTALDQLEDLYSKAGGGQGIVGGNIANFLGSLGLNSDVSTYNQLAQGLINQIGAAIGKTDSLNTEGEVQRALSLVPKITDDQQTAKNKLATLRSLLQTNTGTYNQLYSL